jgi:hypothetical protein
MTRSQTLTVTCLLSSLVSAAPADKVVTYVDIQPQANQDVGANLGRGAAGNNLLELPRGEQTFKGVKFKVEDRFIQLGSPVCLRRGRTRWRGSMSAGHSPGSRSSTGHSMGRDEWETDSSSPTAL